MANLKTPFAVKKGETMQLTIEADTSDFVPSWYKVGIALINYAIKERHIQFDCVDRQYMFSIVPQDSFFEGHFWEPLFWGYMRMPPLKMVADPQILGKDHMEVR